MLEGEGGTWWMDGKALGQGERLHWAPWPGRHELKLTGRDGALLQMVRFEVRGADVRANGADSKRRQRRL